MANFKEEPVPLEVSGLSSGKIKKYDFTWSIENFSFLSVDKTCADFISSPEFPPEDSLCTWRIDFPLAGRRGEYYQCLGNIHLKSIGLKVNVICKANISAIWSNGKIFKFPTFTGKQVDTSGLPSFTNVLELFKDFTWSNQKFYELPTATGKQEIQLQINLTDFKQRLEESGNVDAFKIHLDLTCFIEGSCKNSITELTSCNTLPSRNELVLNKLQNDLSSIYLNQKMCDVIINVKGTKFNAHQLILSARSPVFAAMFQHDMKEKREKSVRLDDCEPDIMKKLLYFLYTGRIEILNSFIALDLLKVADKYALDDLKKLCEDYLIQNLDISNALEVLRAANLYNVVELKNKIKDFIIKDKSHFIDVKTVKNYDTELMALLLYFYQY